MFIYGEAATWSLYHVVLAISPTLTHLSLFYALLVCAKCSIVSPMPTYLFIMLSKKIVLRYTLIWGKQGHHCVVLTSYIGIFNCTKSTCTFLCAQFYHPRKCYILSPSCDGALVALTQIILVVKMLKFSIFTFSKNKFLKGKWRIFTMKNTQCNTMETQFNTPFKWLLYLTNVFLYFFTLWKWWTSSTFNQFSLTYIGTYPFFLVHFEQH
jgi:hypothetical protein